MNPAEKQYLAQQLAELPHRDAEEIVRTSADLRTAEQRLSDKIGNIVGAAIDLNLQDREWNRLERAIIKLGDARGLDPHRHE